MKNAAIKIVSGVVVVALVVVAALAIAGVFNSTVQQDIAVADASSSVYEQQMFSNFDANTVLYIRSLDGKEPTGTADTFVHVVDNEYSKVDMTLASTKDEKGNIGLKPKAGWKEGMFYSVSLASGYVFVNEPYTDLDSFMCIVAARESTDADTKVKDGIVMLEQGKYNLGNRNDAGQYTLTVWGQSNPDAEVFVLDAGMQSKSYRKCKDVGQYVDNGDGSYTLTVEDAETSDVFEYLYVKKTINPQEADWEFNAEATEASIRSCSWYLAAVQYLYGEQLSKDEENKRISVKFTPNFKAGTPSEITLDISIIFKGLWKDSKGNYDDNGKIEIKIANKFIPQFDVHIQDNDGGKAFDVSLDLSIDTTATVVASYANSWTNTDKNANTLTVIANKLAELVKKYTFNKLGNADTTQPYAFAKWIIPIGNLPICIEDELGFELGASFSGQVGVVCSNKFEATFGVVYAGGDFQSYHNVGDTFKFDSISLAGAAGAKVGLFNKVGISAYGTIGVNLGIHAGVYADLAGALSMSGDDLVALFKNEKALNIIPAYYFETGVYASITAEGKVFGFSIKEFTLLNKKFPLYKAGHKYLPLSFEDKESNQVIRMANSYYYITGWDVMAKDIQNVGASESAMNLDWKEFDYEMGPNLVLKDNKVLAKTADEFESYIIVTSKVNKQLSQKIVIIKNPEGPTTTQAELIYDRAEPTPLVWDVMLNASKGLGVTLDGSALATDNYNLTEGGLMVKMDVLSQLSYGAHDVVVETSKGYLNLVARVINSAQVDVDDSKVVFDKASATAVAWDMNLQGNAIVALKENESLVNNKYYNYRASVNQLVMLASYWDAKACGEYTETLTLSNGQEYSLTVAVVDTRKADLNTKVYEYIAGSNDTIALDVEVYENEANTVSSVKVNGVSYPTTEAIVPVELLKDLVAGTYEGCSVTVGGKVCEFTINVTNAVEALIIPVKKQIFNKSSNDAVVFQAKIPSNAKLSIAGCDGFSVGTASVSISADFLKNQKGTEWSGTIEGASNSVTLTVELINDVLPSLERSAVVVGKEPVNVNWNLQDVTLSEVVVDGLSEDQYVLANGYMTVYPAALPYGNNTVSIYTPANTLKLVLTREGTPSISDECVVQLTKAEVATYELDVAHLKFDYVEVDGKDIYASAYRYSNGTLTLANEFVYNLGEGTYTVRVNLTNDVQLSAKLTVQGEIKSAQAVQEAGTYLIYTAEQLAGVAAYIASGNKDASYRLMADIDMKGVAFTPIGTESTPYEGTFDGNGYSVSNLNITETVKVGKDGFAIGMFGVVGSRGIVRNLRVNYPTVSFAKSGSVSAGIVAGRSAGEISNVTISDGSISAESKSWLDIKNAYFDLGGVVGYSSGLLRNISLDANIVGKVKGLNVLGIQIGGRDSLINVGAVVGYFTTANITKSLIKNIRGSVSINADADSNKIKQNGWYGYSDLSAEDVAKCESRLKLFEK